MSGERRPRIRSIKPEFFSDERINLIPVGARYTALGLMSMADDRGRVKAMLPAVHAYVFPNGDISEAQFKKALRQVIDEAQFAWEYQEGAWRYLWLPRFWRHQVINKPSESTLPPHPRDPYGRLSVRDALALFKADTTSGYDRITTGVFPEDSCSAPVGVHPPRAGALLRSVPSVKNHLLGDSQTIDARDHVALLCELLAAHIVANDPKAKPDWTSSRWLSDMRLLLDDRDGDGEELVRIIDWCQNDAFWRSNILSPTKLRKQFSQLAIKAAAPQNVTPIHGRRETASDWLREINGPGGFAGLDGGAA